MSKVKQPEDTQKDVLGKESVYVGEYKGIGLPDDLEIKDLLLITLEDDVLFPFMLTGATVTHPDTIATVKKAFKDKQPAFFFIASETMPDDTRYVELDDVYDCCGSFGTIQQIQENPLRQRTARFFFFHYLFFLNCYLAKS